MLKKPFVSRQKSTKNAISKLQEKLNQTDTIIIGAGAGLSTSAGFVYSGERFQKYFYDFAAKYGFQDMYSGGFYPYQTPEEYWAYWSRNIYINRYMKSPKPVYEELFEFIKKKDYFILTTNVDHQFQKAGFDKQRLFYTQGDYGLFQCSEPCHEATYENEETIRQMLKEQGYQIAPNGDLSLADNSLLKMTIPTKQIPYCPKCKKPLTMNLRIDDSFVEDNGWHLAAKRYSEFLNNHQKSNVLFLELGTGYNTPGIIKYAFWKMTKEWSHATYACINYGEAYAPEEIEKKSICINEDIGAVIKQLSMI